MRNRFLIPFNDLMMLLDMQKTLDATIMKKLDITMTYEEVVEHRKLAFVVELGETANEQRCFKYWSVKEPSEKPVIIEEFADGLHFILSLGVLKGYGDSRLPQVEFEFDRSVEYTKLALTKQMLDVIYYAVTFEYTTLLREYIRLGFMLGFKWDEIVEAYKLKNKKNYERQESGDY